MGIIQLKDPDTSLFGNKNRVMKDGCEVEKGVIITEKWAEENISLLYDYWEKFSAYPDLLLDIITPEGSNFKLFPYQRIFLRSCMRYTNVYITAVRAASKTFLSILAKYLQCVFLPNHVGSIVAPNKGQAAKITKQKIQEIWRIWPLLKKELKTYHGEPYANFGKDYVELHFRNEGKLIVVGANLLPSPVAIHG